MLADLPPSSRNTRFSVSAPRAAMCLPTAVEPVKEIMSTRGSPVSTSPTSAGSADVTTLTTPGGMSVSSATSLPIHVAEYGVSGAGFSTTVQPGRERGRELRQVQHEREVPRRDSADDADRLLDDQPVRRHLRGVGILRAALICSSVRAHSEDYTICSLFDERIVSIMAHPLLYRCCPRASWLR